MIKIYPPSSPPKGRKRINEKCKVQKAVDRDE